MPMVCALVGSFGVPVFAMALIKSIGAKPELPPVVAGAVAVVVVGAWIFGGLRLLAFLREPVRRLPAMVRRETHEGAVRKWHTTWSGKSSSTYSTVLLFEDKTRDQLHASSRVAAVIAPGDVGMAYVKDGVLVEFQVVDV